MERSLFNVFFFFNDTATTEIYTLSLHDALPISCCPTSTTTTRSCVTSRVASGRSEEHTSELQSRLHLVCRLLLEKKNKTHLLKWSRLTVIPIKLPPNVTVSTSRL